MASSVTYLHQVLQSEEVHLPQTLMIKGQVTLPFMQTEHYSFTFRCILKLHLLETMKSQIDLFSLSMFCCSSEDHLLS